MSDAAVRQQPPTRAPVRWSTEGLSSFDAPMLRRMAGAIRPRRRVRPSAWAEANLKLTSKMGVERPGPYRCVFYPWLRAFMDALHDRPDKVGVVAPKPAQNALTMALMCGPVASRCGTRDGRLLYVIGRKESAEKQVSDRWDELERQPALAPRFAQGRLESRRNVLAERNFEGGGIDFVGAGSPGATSSTTYAVVVVDEFDQAQHNFPSMYGDLWPFVMARQTAWRGDKEVWIFSHPTLAGRGIDAVYQRESDHGRWVFDCPRCHEPAALTHACIKFRGVTLLDEPDPDQAVIECPRCGREIADAERRRLVWGPELGGTGRRWSPMPAAQAAARRFLGFAVNGLCNPNFPLRQFASMLVSARRGGEAVLQSTLNTHFGEAMRAGAAGAADPELVRRTIVRGERIGGRIGVPGGELGVRFVTVGVDVQFAGGKSNPWDQDGQSVLLFYMVSMAWAATGMGYVIDASKVLGWPSFYDYLRTVAAVVQPGTEDAGLVVPASACGIDSRYATGQVLEHCREEVYSPVDHRRIELAAFQYDPGSKADNPVRRPSDLKRTHPTKPHLGKVNSYYLHRHTWVKRAMDRWMSGREAVLCEAPQDWALHLTANVMRPVPSVHGLAPDREEYLKPDEFRDDWLQAKAYAEAAAAIECELDRVHELPSLDGRGGGSVRLIAPSIAGIMGGRRG